MKRTVFLPSALLKTAGLVYVTLPVLVFLVGMLKPWIGFTSAGLVMVSMFWALRGMRGAAIHGDGSPNGITLPAYMLVVLACIALAWCILCGQFALCVQTWDWFSRNATFRDLITHSWPVILPKQGGAALVLYLGHWLPSAVIGRAVMLVTGSLDAAWLVGNIFLGLWTVLGVFLVMLLLLDRLRPLSARAMLLVVAGLVFFGTTCYFGPLVLRWKNGEIPTGAWASMFSFSPNHELLSWVFHQTVVPWVATLLLLDGKKCFGHAIFVLALVPICGPFPSTGLAWLLGCLLLIEAWKSFWGGTTGVFARSVLTFPNAVGVLVVMPLVAAFLFTNTAAGQVGPAWAGVQPKSYFVHRWLLFITCELALYAILLIRRCHGNPLYWISFAFLSLCPLLKIGPWCDFCMRASIPLFFVVMLLILECLLESRRKHRPEKFLLAACLLLCCVHQGTVMWKTVCHTIRKRAAARPVAYDPLYSYDRDFSELKLKTLHDRLMVEFSSNILCRKPEDTFFFRCLAKRNEKGD